MGADPMALVKPCVFRRGDLPHRRLAVAVVLERRNHRGARSFRIARSWAVGLLLRPPRGGVGVELSGGARGMTEQ
eukprot:gene4740-3423_t